MDVVTKGVGAAVPTIERRLELLPQFFREDNFRYLVFDEIRKDGVDVARIAPEYPHPSEPYKSKRAKIDAVILDANRAPETAIEFKYHRKNPNPNSDTPHGKNAGELLGDFARLRDFPNVHRFVVYLTDGEMFRYFNNNNRLNWIFSQSEHEISDGNIPSGRKTKTLRKHAGDWRSPVRAQVMGRWDVGNCHKLVVWRIWRVSS